MSFDVVSAPDEFTIVDGEDDWVIYTKQDTEYTLEFVAVGMNDAAAAVAAAAAAEASASNASVSETNAAASAAAAALSETAAETAETNAETAASTAVTSEGNAAASAAAAALSETNAAASAAAAALSETAAETAETNAEAAAALAASVIPGGGNSGEALVKASAADYDYAWAPISGTGDMVAAIYDPTGVGADAFNRANHHGSQLASTISDFSTAADARVSAAIGTTVQAYSANLTTWAGIAPSANVQSLVSAADYAAIRALLDLEAGTDFLSPAAIAAAYQPLDADLTALASAGNSAVLAATTASFTTADEAKLDGVEASADVTDAGNVGAAIHGAAAKAAPVDADTMPLIDSAAANALKKVTWANVKATLKTYFDTLYQPLVAALTSWAAVTRAAGFDTFAATPSSANLRSLLTDETGTGAAVFATSPVLTTPTLNSAGLISPAIAGTILEGVYTITDAAGFAVDPTNGSIQRVTLGANRTPVPANWDNGESVTLLVADGTAFTITWTSFPIVWKGGSAPTLATSGFTEINITKEGGVYRGVHVGDFAS